jgi:glycosyltransferase involved in cell wall biosynthesis
MKICLNPYVEGSGIGTYVLELAQYLAKNTEHEITVIGDKRLKIEGVTIYQSPKKRSYFYEIPPMSWIYGPWQDYKISQLVNKINPDIFHNSDHLVWNAVKCPTIAVSWDFPKPISACIRLANAYEKKWLLPYRIIREIEMSIKDKIALRHVRKCIGVTQYVTQNLKRQGYDAEFIPPGINLPQNPPACKKFEKLTVVFVGRNHIWTRRKGLKYLLDALLYLERKEHLDYRLVIIGNVPKGFDKVLMRYKAIRSHLVIKGLLSRDETLNIIKRAHLLAAPSLYEEFGFAVLEAQSYGLPVIASGRNHSFNEMIATGSGITTNIYDKKEFGETLRTIMKDKARLKSLGINAKKHIQKNYSWEVITPKILGLYEQSIKK